MAYGTIFNRDFPLSHQTHPNNYVLVHADEVLMHHLSGVTDKYINAFYLINVRGIPQGAILNHQIRSTGIPGEGRTLVLFHWTQAEVPSEIAATITDFVSGGGQIIYKGQI